MNECPILDIRIIELDKVDTFIEVGYQVTSNYWQKDDSESKSVIAFSKVKVANDLNYSPIISTVMNT